MALESLILFMTKSMTVGMSPRVFHITPFFELSLVLLTTLAIRLYEVTKKIQRYRQ